MKIIVSAPVIVNVEEIKQPCRVTDIEPGMFFKITTSFKRPEWVGYLAYRFYGGFCTFNQSHCVLSAPTIAGVDIEQHFKETRTEVYGKPYPKDIHIEFITK